MGFVLPHSEEFMRLPLRGIESTQAYNPSVSIARQSRPCANRMAVGAV